MGDCVYCISDRTGDIMNLIDFIVLAALGAVIIFIIVWIIRGKKKGKSGCACCSYKNNCIEKKCN